MRFYVLYQSLLLSPDISNFHPIRFHARTGKKVTELVHHSSKTAQDAKVDPAELRESCPKPMIAMALGVDLRLICSRELLISFVVLTRVLLTHDILFMPRSSPSVAP